MVFRPLHESPLFSAQAEVYERLGMRAWSEGLVPWRATTCPALADVEASLIAAFARDCRAEGSLGPTTPLTVIDVGAGTGRLAFHLAPKLEALGVKAHLVLTDVAPSNVSTLSAQPQLRALADRGLVSFEVFDALAPRPVGAGQATVLLAHYLFDTLPHRVFRLTGSGAAFEGLVDVDETPWAWRYEPATLPRALEGRSPGTFLLPVGAARALEAWRAELDGPLLVLAADKGVTPRGPGEDPLLARHESISAGVDFAALAREVAPEWQHLGPAEPSDVFALHAFTTGAARPELTDAWRRRGAANEVLALLGRFDALLQDAPDAGALLAFLETTHDDPDLLAQLSGRLRELSLSLSEAEAARLVRLLAAAGERHFLFRQQVDVPFTLGITAHHLGALRLAVALYLRSLEESGAHESTLFNLALAQEALGAPERAREALEVLLAHSPGHERATEVLGRLAGTAPSPG